MRLGQMVVDISPLRTSRDFRFVFAARVVSLLGIGFTTVALPVQVYDLTGSSLQVAMVNLVLGAAMLVGTLGGGVLSDRFDRRRLILLGRGVAAAGFAGLTANALLPHPQLWLVAVCAVVNGLANGVSGTALMAATPALVGRDQLAASAALVASTTQLGAVVGPALGGLVIAGPGVAANYGVTAVGTLLTVLLVFFLRPLPPTAVPGQRASGSVVEGWRFVRRNPVIGGLLLVDVCAVVFAMPYALFPALASEHFHAGPAAVGLLYAAPAVGALLGAVTSGWTGRVAGSGRALVVAVLVWGLAITGFGLSPTLPVALALLAVAGLANIISEILRRALLQHHTPGRLQGRVSAVWLAQTTVGPSVGNVEAGLLSRFVAAPTAVVLGGLVCVAGVLLVAAAFPALRRASLRGPSADETEGLAHQAPVAA
ncbi:MFS transporter, ENTS family, enterobactin (siderophore) exporter [Streptoalloteichus tenebrarius]|uniref:MFS transporter, ENTS family, enterobactin (Siderophore) exporter n=1 Tax=Streptoalloteichus tenebrarius (strain ATCC 17920 / DSM 40477 / JCM 4838 / CBS 697.72 / NBRC 16177 / NCIMB 11028 / NRRL B-12390 / A12253. 1 / ISP 5477) TaxID=1933 RepID=A0ABT1HWZ2_STRSD|nr:enterobactin transporter EntS [Streptoalloteichus tenebrarius]MCP2260041.1 MFS transporter, ENTS family, enterobactin (siderophore) exporter [Streptoalloteichus tenebrarius]BFF03840.1 enterobactin transporter EntS [Streptoalloteichus tenebrarius]